MRTGLRGVWSAASLLTIAALTLGACADADRAISPRPLVGDIALGFVPVPPPPAWGTQPNVAEQELFEVCKVFVGAPAPTLASFTFGGTSTNASGTVPVGPLTFDLGDGGCREVWASAVGYTDQLSVTETAPTSTGWSTTWVMTDVLRNPDNSITTTVTNGTGLGPVGGTVHGKRGILVVFTNTYTPPPPPPDPSGCTYTKGYYRNHPVDVAAKIATLGGTIMVGGQTLNAAQAQAILNATPGKAGNITFTSNLLLNAAQQLISAILNGGLTGPSSVQGFISTAQAHIVLAANKTALSTNPANYDLSGVVNDLSNFNEGGVANFPHCGD